MSNQFGTGCRIIAITGEKGGIAKSTTAANLADQLCVFYQKKVLGLDADPQGDFTKHLWATMPDNLIGVDPMELTPTLNELLTDPTIEISAAIYTNTDGVKLIPANHSLDQTDSSITPPQVRNLLVDIMKELVEDNDFIIIDTRRAGSRLTLSVLRVADEVLMPMQAEYLSLENIGSTISDIETMKKLNPALRILGILPTMVSNTRVSKNVKREVQEAIIKVEEKLGLVIGTYSNFILPFEIKRSARHSEASGARLPIRRYIEAISSGWNEERRAKEQEHILGYANLAEMIALMVPAHLYLSENREEYQAFITEKESTHGS